MPDFHSQSRQPRASHVDPFAPPPGEGDGVQGNRPAAGARQVGPGQVLSSAFQGSATAGDFLGLDLEVNEPGAAGGLELASVSPYGEDEPSAASDARPGPRALPPPSLNQLGDEPYLTDDTETLLPDEAPGKRSVGPQVIIAFVVGLAAVVALVLGPRLMKKGDPAPAAGSGTTVASLPKGPSAGDPVGDGAAALPVGATQPSPDDPAGYEANDADLAGDDLVADAAGLIGGPTNPTTGRDPASAGSAGDTSSIGDLLRRFTAPEAAGGEVPTMSALPGPGLDTPIEGRTFDASLFAPESWMSGELVDMVWRDSAVPIEAIAHPVRVMTPRVGPVRVHLDSGEVFEGRLYAVGQNRVWLEGDMGRLGLDGEHVVEFERLDPVQAQADTFDSTSIGTGRRVRVQVPGGVLYGRVLSVVDTRVTLITDAGARVSLESPEIEPLGPSRAILVER